MSYSISPKVLKLAEEFLNLSEDDRESFFSIIDDQAYPPPHLFMLHDDIVPTYYQIRIIACTVDSLFNNDLLRYIRDDFKLNNYLEARSKLIEDIPNLIICPFDLDTNIDELKNKLESYGCTVLLEKR